MKLAARRAAHAVDEVDVVSLDVVQLVAEVRLALGAGRKIVERRGLEDLHRHGLYSLRT